MAASLGRHQAGDDIDSQRTVVRAQLALDSDLPPDPELFLDAAKHQEIRFETTSVEPLDGERFIARGNLIVKETPFEVELEGRVRGHGQGKAGDERVLVDARGSFDWGTTTVELTAAVSAVKEA